MRIKDKVLRFAQKRFKKVGKQLHTYHITLEERIELSEYLDFMMNWRCPEVPEGEDWFPTEHGNVKLIINDL